MEKMKVENREKDKKDIIIEHAGYWELDPKSQNILRKQESEKEKKQFMRMHMKQISEIMRRW